jgi:hypothetical protein
MKQICVCCKIEKPISDFEFQKNRPNPRKQCKVCRYKNRDREKEKKRHREYMKERRKTQPDVVRQNWERSVYGASKEDLNLQSCVICGSTRRLCIDHDHTTGNIRGILCTKCNAGIGMFDDNTTRLRLAIDYLNRSKYP